MGGWKKKQTDAPIAAFPGKLPPEPPLLPRKRATRFLAQLLFSSLTKRIVILNIAALLALVSGVLYFGDLREGLVGAKIESLRAQGKIIAGAISASAIANSYSLLLDPRKLLQMQSQDKGPIGTKAEQEWDFPIDPERVAPLFHLVIAPNTTRARLYDRDGHLLLDSAQLYVAGEVRRYDLPALPLSSVPPAGWHPFDTFFHKEPLTPTYQEHVSGLDDQDVLSALLPTLHGTSRAWQKYDKQGHLVVYVAIPVQRLRGVWGVLLLSTIGGDIDKAIAAEHRAILKVFGVVASVLLILSLFLAYTIASPLRKLSEAADYVRYGLNKRIKIPDYSARQDEVGHLSSSLSAMTEAFYKRLDAIESFAADVSHELKNPLTSLRSAVETLPLAKDPHAKERLLQIIQHDIQRLNRLITDISDASRLDAALAREAFVPLDLEALVRNLVTGQQRLWQDKTAIQLELEIAPQKEEKGYWVWGHDLRLEQVLSNLIENARSFVSPEEGRITVLLGRTEAEIVVQVRDNGPGIAAKDINRIFERFYTDRPQAGAFGQNSGLGLSISAQIITAHGGKLYAENLLHPKQEGHITGACFTILLPPLEKTPGAALPKTARSSYRNQSSPLTKRPRAKETPTQKEEKT